MTNAPPLQKPLIREIDAPPADPSLAPAVQDTPSINPISAAPKRPRSPLARIGLWVFSALLVLVVTTAAWNFVTGLFAAHPWLGWLGMALVGAALALALMAAWREGRAYLRMGQIDAIRTRAQRAAQHDDLPAARAVLAEVQRLYRGRGEVSWGLARLNETQADVLDADALLALAEREVIAPLDRAALLEIELAARQVALITAFVPLALADVAAVLFANMRLIRRLAQIYGGRSGSLGSMILLRKVAGALLGAGGMAMADDMIGSVAGGGVLGKLSRRFGEGVVNGAVTARVGIAAMELSRPLPFMALPRPNTGATVSRALAGVFGGKAE